MNGGFPKIIAVTASLVVTLVSPLAAQETIIFSKPADAGAAAKPDSNLAPEKRHETRGVFSLPPATSIFERTPGLTVAPMSGGSPAPAVSREQQKEWEKFLEKKNKWTLMTPEEILGIPTAEKILGLPEKNGADKLTVEERFTRRQEKAAAGLLEKKPADAANRSDALARSQENVFARKPFESVFARTDEKNPQSSPAPGAAGKSGSPFSSLLNSVFTSSDKPGTRWGNPFNLPAPPPKATPEQLAGMDRFRESLQPTAMFDKAAEARRPVAAVVTPRDPFMNAAPDFNPRGSSFTTLRSDVARPIGLTPLPGITYRPTPTPVRSAAQPDLPPWMREDAEKPSKIPVRKF